MFCRSSLVSEGIGKASIVPVNVPERVVFESHVIRVPLDTERCIPEYIQVFTTMDFFREQMIAKSKTATMTTIGQSDIISSEILLPTLDKQEQFCDFSHHIDKSKFELERALTAAKAMIKGIVTENIGGI